MADGSVLYCQQWTQPLLSTNVLLIVLPIAANNISDKIGCNGPPPHTLFFFLLCRNPPSCVNTSL